MYYPTKFDYSVSPCENSRNIQKMKKNVQDVEIVAAFAYLSNWMVRKTFFPII